MSILIVEVIDTEKNLRQEYTFDRAPIRIGRSPLNELPLDRSFVSHCHGVLQFDAVHCEFVDLGSTNGTFVGDERIPKNQSVAMTPGKVLSIGSLELRVRHGTSAKVDTRASYAFRPSDLNLVATPHMVPSAPPAGALVAAPTGGGPPALSPASASDILAPLYVQYRAGWRAFFTALTTQVPPGTERDAMASELLGRFPELAQEAEFRRWLGTDRAPTTNSTPPTVDAGAVLAAALGLRLGPDSHGAFVERVGQVIERFALAFVELRRGHRQFARDLSVPVSTGDALDKVEDARSLVRHLLDPGAPPERVDELSRAYADVMLHQVALLNGMMAGARELLADLSPSSLSAGSASGPLAWLSRVLGRDERWARFRRRFGDLEEESTLSAVLLGRAFARAYAAAMGQTSTVADETRKSEATGRL